MKKILILIIFFSLFVLTACFPTGEQKYSSDDISSNSTNTSSPPSTPAFIDMELDDNLFVKADVIGTDRENLKAASISLKEFDEELVKDALLENRTIIETNELKNDLFPTYTNKYFQLSDDSSLIIELGSIMYISDYFSEREYDSVIFGANFFMRPDLIEVYKETNLEGIDRENAVEKVETTLNEMGIKDLGEPEVLALDVETLASEWEDYETKDGSQPRKWEKEDEAYVVVFPIMYNQMAITNEGYISEDNSVAIIGSRVMGVVGKDGVIYLRAGNIYDIDETLKENVQAIHVNTALEQIKNKYKDILITDPVKITKISLENVPTASTDDSNNITYELIPAWVFTVQQTITYEDNNETHEMDAKFVIIIDAESGKEIRIGGSV